MSGGGEVCPACQGSVSLVRRQRDHASEHRALLGRRGRDDEHLDLGAEGLQPFGQADNNQLR